MKSIDMSDIKAFKSKLKLLKGYWIFSFIFIIVVALSYSFLLMSFGTSSEPINVYISILNNVLTLVFAVFVGYYAFSQVIENRRNSFVELAHQAIFLKNFPRAQELLEKAFLIDVKNFDNFAELLEIYLILKEFSKFNDKIGLLKKNALGNKEKALVFYLKSTKELLALDLGRAKPNIEDLIKLLKKDPSALPGPSWGFGEIKQSEILNGLNAEFKTKLEKLIAYLENSLTAEDKTKFENEYLPVQPG